MESSVYICNDPVCDPLCDFCWFCEHGFSELDLGEPIRCKKGHDIEFSEGLGYCDEFKCRLHEKLEK